MVFYPLIDYDKLKILRIFVLLSTVSVLSFLVLLNTEQSGNAFVKILSPSKNQQIPINTPVNISGTSKDTVNSDCKIMLVVNKEFPYREVVPLNNFGKGDYSKWSFMLTSEYSQLTLGDNKITSKAECDKSYNSFVKDSSTGKYIKHSSVNVTGVSN